MTADLGRPQLDAARATAQLLATRVPPERLLDAARRVCGLNAQRASAMRLALRARVERIAVTDVEVALARPGGLVRTWLMRGTLHAVAAEDVRWMLAAVGPVFERKGRRRRLELGLDDARADRGVRVLADALACGAPLPRERAAALLAEEGVVDDRGGQAPIHVIALAAQRGVLCLGPDGPEGEQLYVALDDRLAPAAREEAREDAVTRLVAHYLTGFGPASAADFARWSGLPAADAAPAWKRALEVGGLEEVHAGGSVLVRASTDGEEQAKPGSVRLLPAFDGYVLGYAGREDVVDARWRREVYHGGQTVPVLLVDGRAAGVWRHQAAGGRVKMSVRPFGGVPTRLRTRIEKDAEDVARFLGGSLELTWE